MRVEDLTLAQQVAQLFMVGFSGPAPNAITRRFLEAGVGGIIFFRDNFENPEHPRSSAQAVSDLLTALQQAVPSSLPRLLLGIDQEGGQVERLPHTVFPSLLTPRAVALSPEPEALARDMYALMARRLCQLGFNLNFFPTLDVNLNSQNPIIGVRSFGGNAETVISLSQIAQAEFEKAGLIAVGKHFPGHGNGTVDSHLDLPTLHFTEEELRPFQRAVDSGLPAMLVAHGFYPALQTTKAERNLPSSASPAIIQGLLRERCGFEGVIITDDMCMGAITKHRNPVEAALASLRAGVDILLYKQSTDDEWAVYQAVLQAFEIGELPIGQLTASVNRILALKARITKAPLGSSLRFDPVNFSPEICSQESEAVARRGISLLSGSPEVFFSLGADSTLLLVHPDRAEMGNYAFDMPTSESLEVCFAQAGFTRIQSRTYPPKSDFKPETLLAEYSDTPQVICLVTFNANLYPAQVALYDSLRKRFPNIPIILVSAGISEDRDVMPQVEPFAHFSLCSYRPASMKALASVFADFLPQFAKPKSSQMISGQF